MAVMLLAAGASGIAQEFSADIVDLRQQGAPVVAKFFSTTTKTRFDLTPAAAPGAILLNIAHSADRDTDIWLEGSPTTIIRDTAAKQSTALWPDTKKYLTQKLAVLMPSQKFALYAYVHPQNVDDACPEWMDRNPPAREENCHKVGPEMLHGRETVLYELSCYQEICRLWVDRKLHALVKRDTKWNSTELRDIREEAQPARFFEIPAGFTATRSSGTIHSRKPE